jgi:hypothetical protein
MATNMQALAKRVESLKKINVADADSLKDGLYLLSMNGKTFALSGRLTRPVSLRAARRLMTARLMGVALTAVTLAPIFKLMAHPKIQPMIAPSSHLLVVDEGWVVRATVNTTTTRFNKAVELVECLGKDWVDDLATPLSTGTETRVDDDDSTRDAAIEAMTLWLKDNPVVGTKVNKNSKPRAPRTPKNPAA